VQTPGVAQGPLPVPAHCASAAESIAPANLQLPPQIDQAPTLAPLYSAHAQAGLLAEGGQQGAAAQGARQDGGPPLGRRRRLFRGQVEEGDHGGQDQGKSEKRGLSQALVSQRKKSRSGAGRSVSGLRRFSY
jgi:hypothetical protein